VYRYYLVLSFLRGLRASRANHVCRPACIAFTVSVSRLTDCLVECTLLYENQVPGTGYRVPGTGYRVPGTLPQSVVSACLSVTKVRFGSFPPVYIRTSRNRNRSIVDRGCPPDGRKIFQFMRRPACRRMTSKSLASSD
jgi:hypothetical protein